MAQNGSYPWQQKNQGALSGKVKELIAIWVVQGFVDWNPLGDFKENGVYWLRK